MTRRQVLAGSVAAGFALAIRPIAASTIATDAGGLEAGDIEIPAGDRSLPGYRARPAQGDRFPVVLVVEEIFGVHEHIRDVCRRLAKAGYLAVAPELFIRQGDPKSVTDIPKIVSEIVSKVPDAQVMGDLDATAAWAATDKGDRKRLGITGFCWGGRVTWLYAAHSPELRAGVAWYGRLTSPATPLQPKQPIDLAASLRAPVLGLYGGADTGIPLADVEAMRAKLREARVPSEIVVYPDAPHGFHADYRESYRKEAAEDGWKRLLAWFRKNGI